MRHQEDLLAERHWYSWDTCFTGEFRDGDLRLTRARWEALVDRFDAGFWAHVRQAVFEP